MKEILDCHDIKQMVRSPTRGNYLLDLVCSSHSDFKVHVGPQIADHATVIATLPDSLEIRHFAPRRIWHFKDANWEAMKAALLKFDCSQLLEGSVDTSLDVFVKFLQDLMQAHVPQDILRLGRLLRLGSTTDATRQSPRKMRLRAPQLILRFVNHAVRPYMKRNRNTCRS